jgi:hypothetical protein
MFFEKNQCWRPLPTRKIKSGEFVLAGRAGIIPRVHELCSTLVTGWSGFLSVVHVGAVFFPGEVGPAISHHGRNCSLSDSDTIVGLNRCLQGLRRRIVFFGDGFWKWNRDKDPSSSSPRFDCKFGVKLPQPLSHSSNADTRTSRANFS